MKVFITGASGYIGKNLVKYLSGRGFECAAYVRQSSELSELIKCKCELFYESDLSTLNSYFKNKKFDGIIHLATLYMNSHGTEDIPNLINSNITLGSIVLEAAVNSGVKWFINTGTFSQHYQDKDYSPVNLYSATKQAFEDIARFYYETYDICFTTLKISNTYGPNDSRPKIMNLWEKIAGSDRSIDMSPGEQIMDIIYIDDVLIAYEILINHIITNHKLYNGRTYCICASEKFSLKKLAEIFQRISGKTLNIKWGARPYGRRESIIPYTKGTLLPEWIPQVPIEEGIRLFLKKN